MKNRQGQREANLQVLAALGEVEFLLDLFAGSLGQQAHHHNGNQAHQERGQQLIDAPDTAHGLEQVLPDEYEHAAGHHTGHSAGECGTLPEQGADHQGTEARAEACPGKGDDAINGAVSGGLLAFARNHSKKIDNILRLRSPFRRGIEYDRMVAAAKADQMAKDQDADDDQIKKRIYNYEFIQIK